MDLQQFAPAKLKRVARALSITPTAAYSAPHDYPHAAPLFQPAPLLERSRVEAEAMRLYIHVPFCNYACSFCCYTKKVGADAEQMQRYVRALKRELEWVAPGTPVSQFFMGGGTPTALPADQLNELLSAIRERMPYVPGKVHTVEASPESVTDTHLAVLAEHGVERISMGIQSMQDSVLGTIKRGHGKNLALDACRRIIDADFILNIDLMYGLPGQTETHFREDFRIAAENGVHAITAYNLRLNEKTPITRKLQDGERLDLERLMRWRAHIRDTAAEFGYTQTRWHTFKRLDGIANRHERLPTSGSDLKGYQLGIGVSARSSLNHSVYRNHSNLATYVDRIEKGNSPVEEVIHLSGDDLRTQFVARTLGDGRGMRLAAYEATFGNPLADDHGETMERLLAGGLLETDGEYLTMSEDGKLVYDLITLSFYPGKVKKWLLDRLKLYQIGLAA